MGNEKLNRTLNHKGLSMNRGSTYVILNRYPSSDKRWSLSTYFSPSP